MPSYKRFLTNSVIAVLLVVFTGIAGAQTNEYYDSSGAPTARSSLSSATIRIEFDSIEAGFVKLPTLAANENKPIFVNSGGTAMEAKSVTDANTLLGTELTANKDASGGYPGLTLFKINFKNALNTVTSFFTNANTSARTYTFQDRDGTIADNTDLATINAALALKADAADVTAGIGVDQSWVDWAMPGAERELGTIYQNTTGKPIQVNVTAMTPSGLSVTVGLKAGAASPPTAWADLAFFGSTSQHVQMSAIIPPSHYYQAYISDANVLPLRWSELR